MDIIVIPFLIVLSAALSIYAWIVIASVIMSWLISFKVINLSNNFVVMVNDFLNRATEPALMRIRRFLPIMGGFDLSPLVLILILWFFQGVIGRIILKMVGSV